MVLILFALYIEILDSQGEPLNIFWNFPENLNRIYQSQAWMHWDKKLISNNLQLLISGIVRVLSSRIPQRNSTSCGDIELLSRCSSHMPLLNRTGKHTFFAVSSHQYVVSFCTLQHGQQYNLFDTKLLLTNSVNALFNHNFSSSWY